MKRFFYTVVLMLMMVVLMEPAGNLISQMMHIEEPATHQVAEGDWLSKLALKYYGDASYWKELALVNRAPNGNNIYPGEEVILPSFQVIQEIRTSKRLSRVNDLVRTEENIIAGRGSLPSEPVDTRSTEPLQETAISDAGEPATVQAIREIEPLFEEQYGQKDSSFLFSTPMVTGLVLLCVIFAVGIVLFYRRRKREEAIYDGDSSDLDDEPGAANEKSAYFFDEFKKGSSDHPDKKKAKEVELVS